MDSVGSQSNENKRKLSMDAKEIDIPFRVFWYREDPYREYSLKLAKPNKSDWDKTLALKKDYPNVCRERVCAVNQHALQIMHNLNHKNIISMRAVGRSKLQEGGDELSVFLEECEGTLESKIMKVAVDSFLHTPSATFQEIMR
ncbi:hypothetical protein BS78_01G040900 [Paspalum vaginatum]|nr:hypothetical protein BS78_01G040900 [Paspalum vaginatum]